MTPARGDQLVVEQFWTDRWTGSTGYLLPMEARGLYREMLTQAWRRGCRLPADLDQVRRLTGCTAEEWDRCWPLIRDRWRREGESLVNDTQLELYAKARAKFAIAARKAAVGGRVRAGGPRDASGRFTLVKSLVQAELDFPNVSPQTPASDQPERQPGDQRRASQLRTYRVLGEMYGKVRGVETVEKSRARLPRRPVKGPDDGGGS